EKRSASGWNAGELEGESVLHRNSCGKSFRDTRRKYKFCCKERAVRKRLRTLVDITGEAALSMRISRGFLAWWLDEKQKQIPLRE
ncbi:MAG TPA: hypothetical protein VIM62_01760, partial [Acidobacteriaceae bacterium]